MFYVTKMCGTSVIIPENWIQDDFFFWPPFDVDADLLMSPCEVESSWMKHVLINPLQFG